MSVLLITTPLRPVPTPYPPMGSLSIINYARKHGGVEIDFYNIDSLRPSFDEAVAEIVRRAPRVLGISAVVSTAYDYTKRLSLAVKAALPDTLIVVGGNLAASAEILLRRTGTDICGLGEGEVTMLKIAQRAETTLEPGDYMDIPGLALLDTSGKMVNTGYEQAIDNGDVYDVDWRDLVRTSDIDHFIFDPFAGEMSLEWLAHDARAHEPHRQGRKVIEMHASKGCVARCTFCHRFEKGIRYIPVDVLRDRIQVLVDEFDIGYLVIADENFGTDRKWLRAFCEMITSFDILWRVAGMRVNCIQPEFIGLMKASGCVSIIYGMETGSARMLEIMEKKTKVDQNRQAMEWTIGADLYSIIQLIVGMPGETPETVAETIAFSKQGLSLSPRQNPNNLSINYAQALPGTPLYEFARHHGMIGDDTDGEEDYLLHISDKDAHDEISTLNFTDAPALECQTWRPRITIETNYAYVHKFGIDQYRQVLLKDTNYFIVKRPTDGRFANPKRLVDTSIATDSLHETKQLFEVDDGAADLPGLWSLVRRGNFGLAMICYPVLFYRLRGILPLLVLAKSLMRQPLGYNMRLLADYMVYKLRVMGRRHGLKGEYKSLRKIVRDDLGGVIEDNAAMAPLRQGR